MLHNPQGVILNMPRVRSDVMLNVQLLQPQHGHTDVSYSQLNGWLVYKTGFGNVTTLSQSFQHASCKVCEVDGGGDSKK